jgi:hypothetical protein
VHHGDAKRALDLRQAQPHGLDEVNVGIGGEHVVDQVSHHLRVRLRRELEPAVLQLLAQGLVVLHNPIVDHAQLAGLVGVRVAIDDGRGAVRGPARVRDACREVLLADAVSERLEVADLAHGADAQHLVLAFLDQAHAGAVVAAVFEPRKPLDESVDDIQLAARVGDDAARRHVLLRFLLLLAQTIGCVEVGRGAKLDPIRDCFAALAATEGKIRRAQIIIIIIIYYYYYYYYYY